MHQVLCLQVQVQVQVPIMFFSFLSLQVQVQVPCFRCKYISSMQLPMQEKIELLVIEPLCTSAMPKKYNLRNKYGCFKLVIL